MPAQAGISKGELHIYIVASSLDRCRRQADLVLNLIALGLPVGDCPNAIKLRKKATWGFQMARSMVKLSYQIKGNEFK